jgi:hypothetical protein
MCVIVLAAMAGKLALGENEIRLSREAEVRAPVADQHNEPLRIEGAALAYTAHCLAVIGGVGELGAPAAHARRHQAVAGQRKPEALAFQYGHDETVETVGDDFQRRAVLRGQRGKSRERRVDRNGENSVLDFAFARADLGDLPREAFARANPSRYPVLFDLQPFGA